MADNFNALDQASITSAGIIDGTIVNADVNASAAIAQSKIANLTTDLAAKLAAASNLSDLASAATARTNLALGTAAVTNTGTGAGNTILGNDARLTDARTPTAHAASHATGQADAVTLAQSQVTNLTTDLAAKVPASLVDAKGDLIVATAADTVARLAVAADNTALLAPSSGAAGGVAWSTGPTITGELTALDLKVTGMTGAANSGRFVGVTASDAPTSGTFAVGDFVVAQNGQMFVCVTAGTPGSWIVPRDSSDLLATGEETIPRSQAISSAVASTTTVLRMTYFTARKTETTTQVRVYTGTTAAAATPSLCRIGLYTIAANGDGTLVANVANDTTLFAAASTVYTRSWASGYDKVAGQRYALGILVVTAGAAPTYLGGVVGNSTEASVAPALSAVLTGQSDLPSSFASGSLAGGGNRPYAAILP